MPAASIVRVPVARTRALLIFVQVLKGETNMCLDCGCGEPNDDHDDKRHLTMDHIKKAAEASSTTQKEVKQNIIKALQDSLDGGKTTSKTS